MAACLSILNTLRTCLARIQCQLRYSWSIYSKPTPGNIKELFILFLFCLSIASAAGGLLYYWMSHSLHYKDDLSGVVGGSLTAIVALLLFLVHPARCAFTLLIPTLGTKQGRKLLVSGICLLIAANVIPNIVRNIKMLLELCQCIMRSATENILNSTQVVSHLTTALKVGNIDKLLSLLSLDINYQPDIDYKHIENTLTKVNQDINSDFNKIQVWMDRATLLVNRALAGFLFFNLIAASLWYLARYLTDLEFDNNYLTRNLEKLAKSNPSDCDKFLAAAGKLTKTTGLKLSQNEKKKCLIRMTMITINLVLIAAVIAADYGIFHLVSSLTMWTENVPCLSVFIDFKFLVNLRTIPILNKLTVNVNIVNINHEVPWKYNLVPTDCVKKPVPPDMQVIFFISGMYVFIYFMAALDAYVVRICRKIAASFFQKHEKERIYYLYQTILKEYKKDGDAVCLNSAEPSVGGAREKYWAEHGDGGFPQHLQGNGGPPQPGIESETLEMASHTTMKAAFWNLEDNDEEETNLNN